jgi:hypothetical protein
MKSYLVVEKKKFSVVYVKDGYKNFSFVMFAAPTAIHVVTAILNIKDTDTNRGAKALAVVTACGTSTFVIIPIGTITSILALITAFNGAVGAVKKAKWKLIKTALKAMMRTFQTAMDAAPADAASIAASGGFGVKKVSAKQRNVFTLTQGVDSGSLICVGDTAKNAIFHAWWTSRDGINFTLIMGTPDAENLLEGLGKGRIWIQHQYRARKGLHGPVKVLYIDLI